MPRSDAAGLNRPCVYDPVTERYSACDGHFACQCAPSAPALIAEITALRAENERLRAELDAASVALRRFLEAQTANA